LKRLKEGKGEVHRKKTGMLSIRSLQFSQYRGSSDSGDHECPKKSLVGGESAQDEGA